MSDEALGHDPGLRTFVFVLRCRIWCRRISCGQCCSKKDTATGSPRWVTKTWFVQRLPFSIYPRAPHQSGSQRLWSTVQSVASSLLSPLVHTSSAADAYGRRNKVWTLLSPIHKHSPPVFLSPYPTALPLSLPLSLSRPSRNFAIDNEEACLLGPCRASLQGHTLAAAAAAAFVAASLADSRIAASLGAAAAPFAVVAAAAAPLTVVAAAAASCSAPWAYCSIEALGSRQPLRPYERATDLKAWSGSEATYCWIASIAYVQVSSRYSQAIA